MPVITPHVPDGLIEIMKALAKGVLKDKPENIYEFAATHFEKLVFERDGRMDKGYENFRMDEDYFRYHEKYDFSDCKSLIKAKKKKEGKKTGARPTNIKIPTDASEAICDKDILSPEPLQNKLRPRKLSCIKPSEGLISIQEEDGLDATGNAGNTLENEKRQNAAAFTIQDYFKKLLRRKNKDVKNSAGQDGTIQKAMTEESAAFIIQRTVKNLFGQRKYKNATKMDVVNENGISVIGSDVGDKKEDLLENDANRTVVGNLNSEETVSADNLPEGNESKVEKVSEVTSENLNDIDDHARIHGEDGGKEANLKEVATKDVDENNSKNLEIKNDKNEDEIPEEHEGEKRNKVGEIEANPVIEETVKKEKRPGSFSEALSTDETKDIIDRKPDEKILSPSQKKKKKSDETEKENENIDTDDKVDNKNSEKEIASNLTDSEKMEKMDDVLMVSDDVEKNKDSDDQNLKEVSNIVNEATDKADSSNVLHADSGKMSPTTKNKSPQVKVHNLKDTTEITLDDPRKPEEDNEDDITSTKSFEEFHSEPGTRSVMEGQNILSDSDTPNEPKDHIVDHVGVDEKDRMTSKTENKNDESNELETLDPIMAKIDDKVKESEPEVIVKESGIDDLKRQKSQAEIKKTKDQSEPGHDTQSTDMDAESKDVTNTEDGLSKNEENLEVDNLNKNIETEAEKAIKSQVKAINKEDNKNTENMNEPNHEEMAALVIQKTFRGYQTRKPLVENKKSNDIQTGSKSDEITTEEGDDKNTNQIAVEVDKKMTSDDTNVNDENGAPLLQKAKSKDKLQETTDGIKDTKENDDDKNPKQTINVEDKNTSPTDSKVRAENEAPLIKKNISKDHSEPGNDIRNPDMDDKSKDLEKTQVGLRKSEANLEDDNQIHFGYHLPKTEQTENVEPIKIQVQSTNNEDNKKINELNNEDMAKAAIKIQTLFRGYLSRNNIDVRKKLDPGLVDNEILRLAALVIQKTFRGYQARKSLVAYKNAKDMQIGSKSVGIMEGIPKDKTSNQTAVGEDTNIQSEATNVHDETGASLLQKDKSKDKLKTEEKPDAKNSNETAVGEGKNKSSDTNVEDENGAPLLRKDKSKDKLQEITDGIKDTTRPPDDDTLKDEDTNKNPKENDDKKQGEIDLGVTASEVILSKIDDKNIKKKEAKIDADEDPSKLSQTVYDIDGIAQLGTAESTLDKTNKDEEKKNTINEDSSKLCQTMYDIDGIAQSESAVSTLDETKKDEEEKNTINEDSSKPGQTMYDIDGIAQSESAASTLDETNKDEEEKNTITEDSSKMGQTIYDIDGIAQTESVGSPLEKANKNEFIDTNSNVKEVYDIDGNTKSESVEKLNKNGIHDTNSNPKEIYDIDGNIKSESVGPTLENLENINKNGVIIDTNSHPKVRYDIDGSLINPEYQPEEKLVRQTKNLEMLKTDGILSDQDEITEIEDKKSGSCREDDPNSVGQTSSSAGLLPQDSSQTKEETLEDDDVASGVNRKGVWYVGSEPIITSQSQENENEGKDNLEEEKDGENVDKNLEGNDNEEKAATQIQKSYRGYRARRDVSRMKDDDKVVNPLEGAELMTMFPANENEDKAALQIQKSYRGYKTRKGLRQDVADGTNEAISEADGNQANLEIEDDKTANEEIGIEDNNATHDGSGKESLNKEDEEKAAVEIQKSYRGYKTRKDLHHGTPDVNNKISVQDDENKEKSESNNKNEPTLEKVLAKGLEKTMIMFPANENEDKAALQIQKSFRGYKTRKDLKHGNMGFNKADTDTITVNEGNLDQATLKDQTSEKEIKEGTLHDEASGKEVIHEDGDDKEKAAVQIQKSYHGYKSRKDIKHGSEKNELIADYDRADKKTEEGENKGVIIDDTPNEQQQKAALEIQKSYRGYRTRKDIQGGKHQKNKGILSDNDIGEAESKDSMEVVENANKMPSDTDKNENEVVTDSLQKQTQDDKAALQIQKTYRGYRTRKTLKGNNPDDSHTVAERDISETTNEAEEDTENKNDKEKAAVQIQKSYRGYHSRKTVKHDNKPEDSHTVTQEDTSDTTDQAEETGKKDNDTGNENDEEKAAVQIQKTYRGYRTRKTVKHGNKTEDSHTVAQEDTSDTTDQAEETGKKDNDTENKNDKEKAAVQIQKSYRGYRTRKTVKHGNKPEDSHTVAQGDTSDTTDQAEETGKKDTDTENKNDKEKAAVQIQKSYRGYRTRKTVKHGNKPEDSHAVAQGDTSDTTDQAQQTGKKDTDTENKNDKEKAAVQIQKSYRGYRTRKTVKHGNKPEDSHTVAQGDTSDITDQAQQTGKKDNDTENKNDEEKAAVQIQKSYRGYRTRKTVKHGNKPEDSHTVAQGDTSDTTDQAQQTGKKDTDTENKNDKEKAAVQIQKSYRGYRTRKTVKHGNKPEDSHTVAQGDISDITDQAQQTGKKDNDTESKNDEEKAAVQIQKSYRGYRSRKGLKQGNKPEDNKTVAHGDNSDSKDQAEETGKKDNDTESNNNKEKAAVQIQKSYRGYRSRKTVKHGNKPEDSHTVAQEDTSDTTDQAEETGKKDTDTENKNDKEKAAVQIQKSYRGYRTRKTVKHGNKPEDSQTVAQEYTSDTTDQPEETGKKDNATGKENDEEKAAVQIQKSYRGYRSRQGLKQNKTVAQGDNSDTTDQAEETGKKDNATENKTNEEKAAVQIQKSYRGYRSTKTVKHGNKPEDTVAQGDSSDTTHQPEETDRKDNVTENKNDKEKAAVQIQKSYRGYRSRKIVKHDNEPEDSQRDTSYTTDQAKEIGKKDIDTGNENDEEKAAVQIQKTYRGYRSRKHVKHGNKPKDSHTVALGDTSDTTDQAEKSGKKDNDTENKNDTTKAALQIQKTYRGYHSRKHIQNGNKKEDNYTSAQGDISDTAYETEENNSKESDTENKNDQEKAAIQIQKSYRGYRSRRGPKSAGASNKRIAVRDTDLDKNVEVCGSGSENDAKKPNEDNGDKENAALQIQKSYRGYRSRKDINNKNHVSDTKDTNDNLVDIKEGDVDGNEEKTALQIQKSYRGYRSRSGPKSAGKPNKKTTFAETELDRNKDEVVAKVEAYDSGNENAVKNLNQDSGDHEKAALQIQKSYRGYRARKDINHKKDLSDPKGIKNYNEVDNKEDDTDGNEEKAALEIQKSYRGYRARKDLKKSELQADKKVPETGKDQTAEEFVDQIVTLSKEQAALQIQKCYRGYRTRSDLQDGKLTAINPSHGLLLPKMEVHLEEDSSNRDNADKLSIVNEEEFEDQDAGRQDKIPKDEEGAALQIQKTFRGYRSRKELKTEMDKHPIDSSKKEVVHAIESSEAESLEHKQHTSTENEGDDDTAVSKPASGHTPSEDEAALQIQKSYRGYVARKNLHSKDKETKSKVDDDDQTDNKENKLIDEEIGAGEEDKAAVQIQKSYRGYRARRDLQGQMNLVAPLGDELGSNLVAPKDEELAPLDKHLAVKKEVSGTNMSENILSDDEAALKIQKSYRGYKVRKDIENEKKSTIGSDISEKKEEDHGNVDKENKNTTEAELSQISRNNSNKDFIKGKENKDDDLVGTQQNIDTTDLSNDDDKTEHKKNIPNDNLEPNDTGEDDIKLGKTVILSKSYLPLPTRGNIKVDGDDLLPSNCKAEIHNLSDIQETGNLQEAAINIHPDSSVQEQELTDSNENLKKTEFKNKEPDNEHDKNKETSPALDATYITTPSTALVSDLHTPGLGAAQNLRNLTADEAATQIQKSYRGYKARRQTAPAYKQEKPVDEDFYKAPDGEHNVDTFNVEEEKAAIEIQKSYRGYRVRRDLNHQITPIKTAPPNQHDLVSDSGISSNNQSDVDTSSALQSDGETVRSDEPQESESEKSSDSQMKSFEIQEEPFIEKRYSVANQKNGNKRDLSSAESVDSVRQNSQTTIPDIEKIDISAYGEDSLEAMYYSLRKNELMLDKMHQRASEHKSAGKERSNTMPFEDTEPVKNMDEIQKGNIPIDDTAIKDAKSLASEESRPETAIRKSEISKSKKESNSTSDDEDDLDNDDDDADDIDDITSDAIRRNMLAYSVSEADSDYYEAAEKTNAIRDDFNISTAFENVTSSDTDSTIVSAATKIQAGARGFLTRRRLRRASLGTSSFSERRASFGNAAIGKSLDDLIEQQEQIGMDEAASRIQKSFRRYKKRKTHQSTPLLRDSTDDTLSSKNNSDEGIVGITGVKLQQKAFQVLSNSDSSEPDTQQQESGTSGRKKDITDSNEETKSSDTLSPQGTSRSGSSENEKHANLKSVNFDGLNLAARRMTLQRGDAVQRHSTPEEENGNNSVAAVPIDAETGEFKALNKKKTVKPSRIARLLGLGTRQRTMPVQIDSEIMRIIPKHLRKRIKSAETEKKKRNQLF